MDVTGKCQFRRWYSQRLQLLSVNLRSIDIWLYFRGFHPRKSCCITMEISVSGWLTYSTAASKSFTSEKSVYSTVSAKFKTPCFQNSYAPRTATSTESLPTPAGTKLSSQPPAPRSSPRAGRDPGPEQALGGRALGGRARPRPGWQREGAVPSCKCHIWQWFWFYCWGRAGGVFLWETKGLFFTFFVFGKTHLRSF